MSAHFALRARIDALTNEDLARLVMVAVIALDDAEMEPELANLLQTSNTDLRAWSERVIYGTDNPLSLDHLTSVALGLFDPDADPSAAAHGE